MISKIKNHLKTLNHSHCHASLVINLLESTSTLFKSDLNFEAACIFVTLLSRFLFSQNYFFELPDSLFNQLQAVQQFNIPCPRLSQKQFSHIICSRVSSMSIIFAQHCFTHKCAHACIVWVSRDYFTIELQVQSANSRSRRSATLIICHHNTRINLKIGKCFFCNLPLKFFKLRPWNPFYANNVVLLPGHVNLLHYCFHKHFKLAYYFINIDHTSV